MSHLFDYPQDEALDITGAYCCAAAGNVLAPRTMFGVNTSPLYGKPWNPTGYYELKIDTNRDHVKHITFRATFPIGADGAQHVQVEQLTGPACAGDSSRTPIL